MNIDLFTFNKYYICKMYMTVKHYQNKNFNSNGNNAQRRSAGEDHQQSYNSSVKHGGADNPGGE